MEGFMEEVTNLLMLLDIFKDCLGLHINRAQVYFCHVQAIVRIEGSIPKEFGDAN